MSDRYKVLTEALAEHAKNVDGFADRVALAADAALVRLPVDTYGVYCQILPAILNPLQDLGAAALHSCATGLGATATNVKDTADHYAAVDDRNALTLKGLR
ncbi:MAG TPA: type VII secretion target [Pseudonocardiaceae bacterium]|nr:type VII secretion target [Pseudonocardiaceae bacterium]